MSNREKFAMLLRNLATAIATFTLFLASPTTAGTVTIALENAHGDELARAFRMVNTGDPTGAEKIFRKVIADYEARAKPGTAYRCAKDMEDAANVSILAMVDASKDVAILGTGWCDALFGEGFVLIDLNRSAESEPFLARAVEMGPTDPHYLNEYAEWYKSHRKWQRSLDLFTRAWNMVDRSTAGPDRKIAARSLRGMGFNQIELGDLDEAERLFKLSKEYEPESPHVDNELQYIEDLRAKRQSST
jgi:tetratricopeptide (TPR) repeat protein